MEPGQIQDTLDQIFTEDELGQIVSALKKSYFDMSGSNQIENRQKIETALHKIGWVIDEDQPHQIRMLRDYEL
ncbi:hypothetical protein [Thermoflavimicrobium dichotomicum]|uniref:Uncharacterized protein n=1 Tax=Thermoflavimicrobium dichotomicum TaxID=46223 RepID=A0A1I3RZ13_9BACL|nr:hypothetical protein [Thermoflavimicrobium dichotomicum]SFJ51280.1 hypothetical protein SAMN05421852_11179 [Thermoflavimicrobium dichotomicum]